MKNTAPVPRAARNRIWLLLVSSIVLAVANLPYMVGFFSSTPESQFGGFYFIVEDGNSYLAKMRSAALNGWFFRLPYTHELHRGVFGVSFVYTILGKIVSLLTRGTPFAALLAAYHGARVVASVLLLATVYHFVARFSEERTQRLAFLLAVLATGLGWLLAVLGWYDEGNLPLEFWAPDAFPIAILSGPPHIILAVPALLGAMSLQLSAWRADRWSYSWFAALLGITLVLIRPSYVLVFDIVMGATWLVEAAVRPENAMRQGLRLLPATILTLPILVAMYSHLYHDPVLSQWIAQNPFTSPSPLHYLAGYAWLALPAGLAVTRRTWWGDQDRRFLLVWLVLAPLMAYAPFRAQRRLIGGVQAPLAIAAAWSLWQLGKGRTRLPYIWLGLALPGTLFLALGGSLMLAQRPPVAFRPSEELGAIRWLATHATQDDVVLAAEETGNLIPVYSGARVLLGHPIETIHFAEKEEAVARFFDSRTSDGERAGILSRYEITLVFLGPWERQLGRFDPAGMPGLSRVYSQGTYVVFRVVE